MNNLLALAAGVGLSRQWIDAKGCTQIVAADDLSAILEALGYPAGSAVDRRRSWERLNTEKNRKPIYLTGDTGKSTKLPPSLAHAQLIDLHLEQGQSMRLEVNAGHLPSIDEAGYHRVEILGHELTLAIAPPSCHLPHDGGWGLAIQIPSLRGPGPFGAMRELKDAAQHLGKKGANHILLSPVHAILPASGARFSPYAPSSRRFLNAALGVVPQSCDTTECGDFIDWEAALPSAYDRLRKLFDDLSPRERAELNRWAEDEGPALRQHATFDALYLAHGALPWRRWPIGFQHASGREVADYASRNARDIALHLLGQKLANEQFANAQASAKRSGMDTGLIADVAVGVDPDGSDVWADPSAFLQGLTVGAPPDPLGPAGQNWGLTTFSPMGLHERGFAPWIAVIRAALRHAGGARIDHAFGLQRLWLIPDGRPSSTGAYLSYPLEDMMRILTLESHRSRAVVIAEDLGTVPTGFRNRMEARSMMGMRVLWFERAEDGEFASPSTYPRHSVAMTGTHDTPTVAGWWRGRDLEWAAKLTPGFAPKPAGSTRRRDRQLLWKRLAKGSEPSIEDTGTVVDAALTHVASARSTLKILQMEDLLGLEEQTNIPGTAGVHPNWRRRLPASFESLLSAPDVLRRIDILNGGVRPQ